MPEPASLEIARELVRIPSVNPDYDPDSDGEPGVQLELEGSVTEIDRVSGILEIRIRAHTRRERDVREQGYRHKALGMYPWVCGRCAREFTRANVHELTVHHRDHDHDNNPEDGSNWELLCLYCHDNEHARYVDAVDGSGDASASQDATHRPFAALGDLLKKGD